MPILSNHKHELFAQALAKGSDQQQAYKEAGYRGDRTAASRLAADQTVKDRVAELLAGSADKAEVTQAMVIRELARIGFSDIRKAVKWNGQLIREEDNPEGGDVLVIKETRNNLVLLVDSDDIDDDTAAAISEISQNATGGVKVKFHDKRAALVDLGKHLGLFKEEKAGTGDIHLHFDGLMKGVL